MKHTPFDRAVATLFALAMLAIGIAAIVAAATFEVSPHKHHASNWMLCRISDRAATSRVCAV